MNKGMIFTVVALSLSLSSCGVYSKYERRESVDKTLYGEVASPIDESSSLADLSWRELFSEPALVGYIEQALANNADMRTAELRVEQAQSSLKTARLSYLPSLSLSPQGTIAGLVDGGSSKSFSLPVATSWEIDIFGRVTNTKLVAKMQLEQQVYSAQAIRTELVAAVANIYYTITMLNEQISIAEATEQSWRESLRASEAMMKAGMMDQAGLSQIQAGLYGVEISLESLRRQLKSVENSMCSLLATTPETVKGGKLTDLDMPEKIKVGVPLLMLSKRPDVMATESALAASFYSRNVARSALYPSLSLTGSLGWSNSLGSAVLDPADFIYSLVGQIVQPIFSRGLNRAQLRVAEADLEIARIAFEQKLLDAGIEVNDAIVALETTIANAKRYNDQVTALKVAVDGTALKMKHGSTTYLEVLTAQQSLFNAELSLVSNRYDQMQSLISLYKSLGGGQF